MGQRISHCENCELVIDRDLNGAINLEQLLYS
jgi:transposase